MSVFEGESSVFLRMPVSRRPGCGAVCHFHQRPPQPARWRLTSDAAHVVPLQPGNDLRIKVTGGG